MKKDEENGDDEESGEDEVEMDERKRLQKSPRKYRENTEDNSVAESFLQNGGGDGKRSKEHGTLNPENADSDHNVVDGDRCFEAPRPCASITTSSV